MLLISSWMSTVLPTPAPPNRPILPPLRVGREQVDDLDAGDQDRGFGRLVDEGGSLGVDRRRHVAADRAALVDRLADDVHDPAERLRADRHADLRAGRADRLAAGQAVGRVHGDGADDILAEVLRDFEDQAVAAIVGLERGQDRRQLAFERDVDDGADDLADAADEVARAGDVRGPDAGRGRGGGLLGAVRGLVSAAVAMSVFLAFSVWLERFGARNDFDEFGGDHRLALAVVLDRQAC